MKPKPQQYPSNDTALETGPQAVLPPQLSRPSIPYPKGLEQRCLGYQTVSLHMYHTHYAN